MVPVPLVLDRHGGAPPPGAARSPRSPRAWLWWGGAAPSRARESHFPLTVHVLSPRLLSRGLRLGVWRPGEEPRRFSRRQGTLGLTPAPLYETCQTEMLAGRRRGGFKVRPQFATTHWPLGPSPKTPALNASPPHAVDSRHASRSSAESPSKEGMNLLAFASFVRPGGAWRSPEAHAPAEGRAML